MSAKPAAVDPAAEPAPKKGNKKLIIIIIAALLVVMLGGGAAVFMMKKKPVAEEGDEQAEGDDAEAEVAAAEKPKDRPKTPPTFVPLEPFVVNLADKEADRFAQIGITLEVEDAKFAEELKAYMPAIRNGVLMVLAHKTSQQLLQREGKVALAREIMREAVLPLGITVSGNDTSADAPEPEAEEGDDEAEEPKPKKRKRRAGVVNPIKHVHFSNFIVQ